MIKSELDKKLRNPVVIWIDKFESFTQDYEQYISEHGLERFVFEGSYFKLRQEIIEIAPTPSLEKKILIYIPGEKNNMNLLDEYFWQGEIFDDSIQDILSKYYPIRLPINPSGETNKKLLYIKTKWDMLSENIIDDLTEDTISEIILQNNMDTEDFDKRETVLRFMMNIEYYKMLADVDNLDAFVKLVKDYYDINLAVENTYEEMVEALAKAMIDSEIKNHFSAPTLTNKENKFSYRRLELFDLWSKHEFYRKHFKTWSNKLSYKYQDLIAEKTTEELYTIQGIESVDEELWNRLENDFSKGGINVELLTSNELDQYRLVADARSKLAVNTDTKRKWYGLLQLILFISELNEFNKYMKEKGLINSNVINNYLDEKWWQIDLRFRKVEELKLLDNRLVSALIYYAHNQYVNRFLKPLNTHFQNALVKQPNIDFPEIKKQRNFWSDFVKDSQEKTAVIYVDALRYEMGQELGTRLKEQLDVTIDSILSSAPSITKVGMAALLPLSKSILHWNEKAQDYTLTTEDNIQLNDKNDRVKYLQQVLKPVGAIFNLETLFKLPPSEIKKEISSLNKIVVYSTEIDTTGENIEDSAIYMFSSLLKKIVKVVEKLIDSGVDKVVITADHGFLLTNGLEGWNEVKLSNEVEIIKKSRRYAIAKNYVEGDWIVKELSWSNHEGNLFQYYPRSNYYFTAQGGAKFSHGGLSIQEMLLPVIEIQKKELNKEYLTDPRLVKEQMKLGNVESLDTQVVIQEKIKQYIISNDDNLSKKEKFLLDSFLQIAKWSENELTQKAASKGIKFRTVLVSEAMNELLKRIKKDGHDWFKVEMVNGMMYEYILK